MTMVPIRANQWTGFYMIGTSVMKELRAKKTVVSERTENRLEN